MEALLDYADGGPSVITSVSPWSSVISIPELITYAFTFVIAIVLEVIYLAIT